MGIVSERRLQAASYQDLQALQAKITDVMSAKRESEKPTLAEKLSQMAAEYDLSLADLVGTRRKRRKSAKTTVEKVLDGVLANGSEKEEKKLAKKAKKRRGKGAKIKYRNPSTGQTWSGRGKVAGWLTEQIKDGRKLAEFRV